MWFHWSFTTTLWIKASIILALQIRDLRSCDVRPPAPLYSQGCLIPQLALNAVDWLCMSRIQALQSLSRVGLFMTMDCSPPGSSVHGILQPRILEWVAMPSSRGSSWPRDWTQSPAAPVLQVNSFTAEPTREAHNIAQFPWNPPKLLHIPRVHSFILLCSVP